MSTLVSDEALWHFYRFGKSKINSLLMASPISYSSMLAVRFVDGCCVKMYKHLKSLLIYFVFVIKAKANAMRFLQFILI
jgi:hypothetical protein